MRQDELDHVTLPWLVTAARWRTAAACRSADPDLFFPVSASADNPQQVAEAKAICACCLVRCECLTFAIRTRQLHGIWGGMTEEERHPLVMAERRADNARKRAKAP
jgi:WhiB family redox-sensing transcriptional regulator